MQAALIILAGWFVYAPALRGGWLWDDHGEIRGNADLRSLAGLGRIWLGPDTPDYLPVKTTVQWVQWHLWGDDVTGYHLTNLGLHLLSAFLLWQLLSKLRPAEPERGPRAGVEWVAGLLFVVHPLAVESVAWISELKNALSLPLMLLAMSAYLNFDRGKSDPSHAKAQKRKAISGSGNLQTKSPKSENPIPHAGSDFRSSAGLAVRRIGLCVFAPLRETGLGSYFLSLALFILAMLSKGSVVMFPCILLLYAWWKRGRVAWADVRASAPFFAVALVLGLVAVAFQFHRAFGGQALPVIGLLPRFAAAGLAIAFYLGKCVLPLGLIPNYPRWEVDPPAAVQFLPWVAIAVVLLGLVAGARSRAANFCKDASFGLGWFMLFLLPVIGFVPMSYQRISWVADHLAYIPLVGIVALAAASAGKAESEIRKAKISSALPLFAFRFSLFIVVAVLALASRSYAGIFRDEQSLWTYTVAHNPGSWLGYGNLGIQIRAQGRPEEAIGLYEKALALRPDDAETHNDLGIALADLGRVAEALAEYGQALRLRPDFAQAYGNEGNLLLKVGRTEEAMACLRQALQLDPDLAGVRNELGNALARGGRLAEAIDQYEAAARIDPGFAKAEENLANALSQSGRYAEAIPHFDRALQLEPSSAIAHYNYGLTLRALGRLDDARAQWLRAAQLARPHPGP